MASCPKCKKTFADTLTTCPDDGEVLVRDVFSTARTDLDLKRGDTVGEYVIEGKIGSGTFGEVYRAIQPLIGKQVAIKILSRKYSADPHIVSRFIAEARAVNQIRHKNIIDIFSFGQLPDGRHYHIMELLNGRTLDEHLDERGRLSVQETIAILQPLARALDAAHAAGIAHRDLKPANVFLARDDDGKPFPKLLDFGIAKLLSDDVPRHHQTATGAAVGTPDYMSPEQCQGPNVDHRTDIYAFGIMTYQLLTGRLPFIGTNVVDVLVKQMTATAEPVSKVQPEVPETLDRPIAAMLEKDKNNRPPTLAAAIRALEQAAISAGIAVLPSSSTGDPAATPPLGLAPKIEVPVAAYADSTVPNMVAGETRPDRGASRPAAFSESVLSDTLPSQARAIEPPASLAQPRRRSNAMLLGVAAAGAVALIAALSVGRTPPDPPAPPIVLAQDPPRLAIAPPAPPVEIEPTMPAPTATAAAAPAKTATAAVELAATVETIELKVTTEPEGVEIFAPGGVLLGKSPCTVTLSRGTEPITLELRAHGFVPLSKEIIPLASGELVVKLSKKNATKTIKTLKKAPKRDDLENPF